jgi:hypothetical protein
VRCFGGQYYDYLKGKHEHNKPNTAAAERTEIVPHMFLVKRRGQMPSVSAAAAAAYSKPAGRVSKGRNRCLVR